MKTLLAFAFFIGFIGYSQDGSPDLGFGGDGSIGILLGESPVPPIGDGFFYGIQETSEGNYFAYAEFVYLGHHVYLISILEDGTLDPNWGIDGFLELEEITNPYHKGIHIQNDGKFLLKNHDGNTNGLYRYLSDGQLDNTFGNSGYLEFVYPNNNFQTFIKNDFIYYSSTINTGADFTFIVEKYTPDGQFDNSFGNNGILEMPFGSENTRALKDWSILPNEEIVIVFEETDGSSDYYQIAKFDNQGSLISAYGNNGISSIIPVDPIYNYNSTLIEQNGECFVNFMYFDADDESFKTFFKITDTGQIDLNFADQGEKEGLIALLVQENGRILVDNPYYDFEGGYTMDYSRLFSNGATDDTFNFDPVYNGSLGYTIPQILDNGKLLIASGPIWYSYPPYLSIQRLHNSPLSIDEFQSADLSLSPNPSEAIFQLKFGNGNLLGTNYAISDISGKLIQTDIIDQSNYTLDLTGLESGMYFLVIGNQSYKLLKK